MAGTLEAAFRERWAAYQRARGLPEQIPAMATPMLRVLFETLSEGVLRHLRDHLPESTAMSVTVEQTVPERIRSVNLHAMQIRYEAETYPRDVPPGTQIVEQTSPPMQSAGEPSIVEVEVEDLP
jgi:hypothetical protein